MSNSFFDCMIVTDGRKSCMASDLYTRKDPWRKTPQSFHDLSWQEKHAMKNNLNNPNRRDEEEN